MIPVRFTTSDLPIREQFDAWRGWFDGVFNIALNESEAGFAASSVVWTLDEFGLSHVRAPALTAVRDTALLRANPIDHWVITLGHRRTVGSGGGGLILDVPGSVPYVASLGRELVGGRSTEAVGAAGPIQAHVHGDDDEKHPERSHGLSSAVKTTLQP